MDATSRIERTLHAAIERADARNCPPLLAAAMRHAVFPRGARIRPRLCLAVASACGDDQPRVSQAAAASIELLHCASLVHDDLPCFDDAATRRGRASVHAAFGEPLAVLAGDALIVLAFQTLAAGAAIRPTRLATLLPIVAGAVGVPSGIVAGQAWECEASADLSQYQRGKDGCAVRRRDRRRRRRRRRRGGGMAPARRPPGGGLPGGRRYPRRRLHRSRSRQAGRAGRRVGDAPARWPNSAWMAPSTGCARWRRRPSPPCRPAPARPSCAPIS